jgi:hypothetical protein
MNWIAELCLIYISIQAARSIIRDVESVLRKKNYRTKRSPLGKIYGKF